MLTIEIDPNLKGLSKFVSKDIFNKIILEKDKKFFYNESCKYDKLQEHFQIKYKPLIDYEIKNKIIDKNLVLNIINIFLYLILTIVGLYLFQGFITGILSDSNISIIANSVLDLPLKLATKLKLGELFRKGTYELYKFISSAPVLILYSILNGFNVIYYNSDFNNNIPLINIPVKWLIILIFLCISVYMLLYTVWLISYFVIVFFQVKYNKISKYSHDTKQECHNIINNVDETDKEKICNEHPNCQYVSNDCQFNNEDGYNEFIIYEITKNEYWIAYLVIYVIIYIFYSSKGGQLNMQSLFATFRKSAQSVTSSISSKTAAARI